MCIRICFSLWPRAPPLKYERLGGYYDDLWLQVKTYHADHCNNFTGTETRTTELWKHCNETLILAHDAQINHVQL
jgi:hypothetical protein